MEINQKSLEGFVCITPQGIIWHKTTRQLRRDSIGTLVGITKAPWSELKKEGYTCAWFKYSMLMPSPKPEIFICKEAPDGTEEME